MLSACARLTAVVVLPTPPFWVAIEMIFAMPYSFEPSEYADKGVRVNSGRDELSRYFRQYTIEGSVNEPLQVPDFVPEIVI